MKTKELDLFYSYLAGVIDSDGSISIIRNHRKRKNINYSLSIQITWIDNPHTRKVFNKIIKTFGGSYNAYGKNKTCYKNSKPYIKYNCTSLIAKNMLIKILPYLKLKFKQAKLGIKLQETVGNFNHRNNYNKTKLLKLKQERMWLKAKFLNSKNNKAMYENY